MELEILYATSVVYMKRPEGLQGQSSMARRSTKDLRHDRWSLLLDQELALEMVDVMERADLQPARGAQPSITFTSPPTAKTTRIVQFPPLQSPKQHNPMKQPKIHQMVPWCASPPLALSAASIVDRTPPRYGDVTFLAEPLVMHVARIF